MNPTGIGSLGALFPTVKKPKVFVSYHHRGDLSAYVQFSQTFHDTYEVIYDNSVDRLIDSEDPQYVRQRIRDNFITGTSCTVVLVGRNTWGRKYVDWEIDATLDKGHGLIGIRMPSAPVDPGGVVTVPARLHDNIVSGYALWLTWAEAIIAPEQFPAHVAFAKLKSARLIVNTRDRRYHNATVI